MPNLFNPARIARAPFAPNYVGHVLDRHGRPTAQRRAVAGCGLAAVQAGLAEIGDFTDVLTGAGGVVDVIAQAAEKIRPTVKVDLDVPAATWSKVALVGAGAAALALVTLLAFRRRR